jgi:hypothetical protein
VCGWWAMPRAARGIGRFEVNFEEGLGNEMGYRTGSTIGGGGEGDMLFLSSFFSP